MKERLALTGLWALSLLAAAGLIVAYTEIEGPDGLLAVLPEQRMDVLRPVLEIYGLYLGGILLFWFGRPFPATTLPILGVERVRFWIAVACTILFNLILLGLIARPHFVETANVLTDVNDAVRSAKYLSWVVGPVNAYYFGTKAQ